MKSMISMISVAALAAFASLAPIAQAQSTVISARVNVPFSFDYGTKHLPAGTYIVSLTDDNLVTVSGDSGTAMATADVNYDARQVSATQVTFNKYGDLYFLEGLTISGKGVQASIFETKKERSLANEWAMNSQVPERQSLALLLVPHLGR